MYNKEGGILKHNAGFSKSKGVPGRFLFGRIFRNAFAIFLVVAMIVLAGVSSKFFGVASAQGYGGNEGGNNGNASGSEKIEKYVSGYYVIFKAPEWKYAVECEGCSDRIKESADESGSFVTAECPLDKTCFIRWCNANFSAGERCRRGNHESIAVYGKALIKLENLDEEHLGYLAGITIEDTAVKKYDGSDAQSYPTSHGNLVLMPGAVIPGLERGDYVMFNPPVTSKTLASVAWQTGQEVGQEVRQEIVVNIVNIKETKQQEDGSVDVFKLCGYPFPEIARKYEVLKGTGRGLKPSVITITPGKKGCDVAGYEIYPLSPSNQYEPDYSQEESTEIGENDFFRYRCGGFYYFLRGKGSAVDCVRTATEESGRDSVILRKEDVKVGHPDANFTVLLKNAELIDYYGGILHMHAKDITASRFSFSSPESGEYEMYKIEGMPVFSILTPEYKSKPFTLVVEAQGKKFAFALHDSRYKLNVGKNGNVYSLQPDFYLPFAKEFAQSIIGGLRVVGINLRIPVLDITSGKGLQFLEAYPARSKPYESYCETDEDCSKGECINHNCVVITMGPAVIKRVSRKCVVAEPGDSLTKILKNNGWGSINDVVIISRDGKERTPYSTRIKNKKYYFLDIGEKVCLKSNIEYANDNNKVRVFTEVMHVE